jgi:DNA repair protein RecO (recombination protein O)
MLEKTQGIVLKNIPYSESSIITKIFTKKFGTLSFLLQGVKSKNKRQTQIIQPLQFLEMEIYYRQQANLEKIKEFQPSFIYESLTYSINKKAIATFLLEILNKVSGEKEANPELFDFYYYHFQELDTMTNLSPYLTITLLYNIADLLGFSPDNNKGVYFNLKEGAFTDYPDQYFSTLNQEDSAQFKLFLNFVQGKEKVVHFNRNTILDILIRYFKHHVENFGEIKSLSVFREIL